MILAVPELPFQIDEIAGDILQATGQQPRDRQGQIGLGREVVDRALDDMHDGVRDRADAGCVGDVQENRHFTEHGAGTVDQRDLHLAAKDFETAFNEDEQTSGTLPLAQQHVSRGQLLSGTSTTVVPAILASSHPARRATRRCSARNGEAASRPSRRRGDISASRSPSGRSSSGSRMLSTGRGRASPSPVLDALSAERSGSGRSACAPSWGRRNQYASAMLVALEAKIAGFAGMVATHIDRTMLLIKRVVSGAPAH
jgi:hypothetical protein